MKNHKHVLTFLAIGVFVALLSGCGGGGGGSDVTVTPSQNALNAESRVCAQCHSAEGASYALSLHNTENAATCAQCHQPAPGHPNPTTAISDPDAAGICLNCHTARTLPHFNPNIVNTAGSFDGHAAAQYVDAALTSPNNSILFPGITGSQLGCKACHNPHDTSSRMTIFRDYARNSGHGDVNGEGWIHYRWKGSDRAACQRCHTTSAFLDKLNGGTGVLTFAANDNTKQTLYCIGCHVDNTYAVRSAGAVTNDYGDGVVVTFPDIGKSNLCMNCHTGRENGDSIKANTSDFSKTGFINSHYLTGGATVYASSGYTYTGRSYANPSFFEHDKIGTAAFPTTGSGGPCVGCHMQPARHTFKPVTLDPNTEAITSIASNVCVTCHKGGFALTVASLNEEKEDYEAALQALQTALAGKGLYFANSNPYFFTAPYVNGYTETGTCSANLAVRNWQTGGTTNYAWNGSNCTTASTVGTAGTAGTGKDNMGAAFNLNLLRHDFGAFTHNSVYVRRLIYDGIDWIDDNALNNTVEATINALPVGATAYTISAAQKTAAIKYLVGGPGGSRP